MVNLDKELKLENVKNELKENLKMIGFDNHFSDDVLYRTFRNDDNKLIVEVSVGLDKDMILYAVLGTGFGEITFRSEIDYENDDVLNQISTNVNYLYNATAENPLPLGDGMKAESALT